MASAVDSPQAYLENLPEERRLAIEQVRQVIRDNLSREFEEGIQYGMLAYYVPHSLYPKGYHANPKLPLPCLCLASQKNHMALYLMCLYTGSEQTAWFEAEWRKTGKKLDMGKSCLRFKKVEDLALDVLSELFRRLTVRQYVLEYEASLTSSRPAAKTNGNDGRAEKSASVERPSETRRGSPKPTTKTKSATKSSRTTKVAPSLTKRGTSDERPPKGSGRVRKAAT